MLAHRYVVCVLALHMLLIVHGTSAGQEPVEKASKDRQATGDVTDVVVVDRLTADGPFEKIWQPFIARWSDRQYVVTYGLQLRGKPDMGDIVCSVSTDRGQKWLPPTVVFDHRVANGSVKYAYNNSVLYKPPGQGVLWCFAMRCPQDHPNSEDSHLCAAYSGDGGRTWHHVELVMEYHHTLITCAGIERVVDADGIRYLLPAHRNTLRGDPRGSRDHFVLESRDLLRWKLAAYVPQPTDQGVFLHEGNIAVGEAPNELKMVMRTATYEKEQVLNPPVAYSTVSKDGGRTWSVAAPEPQLPNFRSKAFYGRDSQGRHVYVYSDHVERRGLWYKIQAVDGAWSEARPFFDGNTRNSYPTLLEETPGQWLAVWDSSNDPEQRRTMIRFGRFRSSEASAK